MALDDCGRTTPSLGAGAIWVIEKMPTRRVMPNLITLPDGNILIINGAGMGVSRFNVASTPILTAVLYEPLKVYISFILAHWPEIYSFGVFYNCKNVP